MQTMHCISCNASRRISATPTKGCRQICAKKNTESVSRCSFRCMHGLQLMHVCVPESTFLTLNCIDYHLSSLHGVTAPPHSASSRGQRWWRQWWCCESNTALSWRCPVDLRWCIFALRCFSFDCIASYWDALLCTSHRGAGEKTHTYLRWCITELNMSCEKAQNIGVDISQVASARTPPNSMQCVSSENDSSGAQNQERPPKHQKSVCSAIVGPHPFCIPLCSLAQYPRFFGDIAVAVMVV